MTFVLGGTNNFVPNCTSNDGNTQKNRFNITSQTVEMPVQILLKKNSNTCCIVSLTIVYKYDNYCNLFPKYCSPSYIYLLTYTFCSS